MTSITSTWSNAFCFVSASAVNPSLTVIANAIRIANHLIEERLD